MKLMSRFYVITALLLAAVIVAGAVWLMWPRTDDTEAEMQPARIADIQPMAALCTMELYEEMPIRGRVGTRHLVARATLTGSISFDLDTLAAQLADAMPQAAPSDTIRLKLPPETVELRESTEPGSYTVIDTWNEKMFGSELTTAQENAIKRKALGLARKRVYARGHVRRARVEAAATLTDLLSATTGRTVIVTP